MTTKKQSTMPTMYGSHQAPTQRGSSGSSLILMQTDTSLLLVYADTFWSTTPSGINKMISKAVFSLWVLLYYLCKIIPYSHCYIAVVSSKTNWHWPVLIGMVRLWILFACFGNCVWCQMWYSWYWALTFWSWNWHGITQRSKHSLHKSTTLF